MSSPRAHSHVGNSHEQGTSGSPSERATSTGSSSQDQSDRSILPHVATSSLSLSHPPFKDSPSDDSSQGATDFVSNLASTPPSPTSESVTSFDFESDSLSGDQLSSLSPQPSLYSLTDSLKEQAVRWEYGRCVNTHSDVYKFAADEQEAERLDRQHEMYKKIFGDYVPPFREVLEDEGDALRPKACLDIGCGSGAWILEVASAFPHVSCAAVDLVPLPAMTQVPSNLRFEIDDVTLGLEHFAGDFDVVHVQLLCSGIKDYYRLIDDVALALRPHGLADFTESDWRVYDTEKQAIIPSTTEIWGAIEPPEGWAGRGMARSGTSPVRHAPNPPASRPSPYLARLATLSRQASLKRGAHVDAAALLQRWISEHPSYEDVTYREAWLPVGEWLDNVDVQNYPHLKSLTKEELDKLRWIGKETGEDIIEAMLSTRPLLLSTGVPDTLVQFLTEKSTQEVREARTPLYFRAQNVYARKRVRQQDAVALLTS